jgi:4-amino-4-deoxy-L-arabinose transferase-like glycosyltransferase
MTEASRSNRARPTARQIAALLFTSVGLRIVGLWRPCLSDDEAIYCVVAREMLAGRVLYRDVVDHKPPLIYVVYALMQSIGGPTNGMRLLHFITAAVVFATALLIGRLARVATEADIAVDDSELRRVSFWAALLYISFSSTLFIFDGQAANCELFMMLPLVGSVAVYFDAMKNRAQLSRLWVVGLLVGVAILFKYQAAVQLPLYAIHSFRSVRRKPARVAAVWAALTGGLLVALGGALAVALACGAWSSAWFWFRFNFAYIKAGLSPTELLVRAASRIFYGVAPALFLWILGLRAALAAIRRPAAPGDPNRFDRVLTGWLLVSAIAVTAGGRFFGHYFHQVTAPLAALAAPEAARLARHRRGLVTAALAIPVAVFFLLGIEDSRVKAMAGDPEPNYPAIAAFVAAHSAPTDSLAVWGNAPRLYFEARRPLGCRFVFSNYLSGLSPGTRTQTDPQTDASANVVAESWDMFESDMAERRPRLFVDTSPGNIAGYGKFPPSRFARLRAVLARDYTPLGEVAGAVILERRSR